MDGVKERYHYDEFTDRLTVERVQDVAPILEANKRAFNDAGGYKSEVFNHVARVPLVVLEQWAKQKGISYQEMMNDQTVLNRFLNDPENRYFRTRPGKL